ncbi:thymus-specific serine protease-like [Mya arenaria]|uniref:thymus-specific serine protease-like n=1 Tax=Mya arenaria TaxID=6604 RepID=UPI0022E53134|nr:thymus-specific serine protease-like [Mya arenaria]
MKFGCTFCVLLSVVCVSYVIEAIKGNRFWKIRERVEEHRRKHADAVIAARHRSSPVKTFFIEQPLDHFNAISKGLGKTYKQRYYVNAEFWFGNKSPVFLFIGGEGTLTSRDVEIGEMYNLGKANKALLLGVEHRFYGASLNDDGLQLEELQYLSSQQALADLATFVHFIRSEYGIPESTPWICFGGSYPGALSAWFRLKYPQLVAGAVASSAPVRAVTNFEGYNDVVAKSLSNPVVGGSPECLDAVRTAFSVIDSMIDNGKTDQLKEDFLSCNHLMMKEDQVQFVTNLAGNIMGVVQYNNEIPGQNISHVCDVMLSASNPYSNLIKLNKEMLLESNETCVDNCFMNYTRTMSNTTVDRNATGAGIRQWTFQTCSQFGYYQTCDKNTSCPFSKLMSLDFSDLQICQKVFKINEEDVFSNVQFSNDYYGANHTAQSNIVFVNGNIDPWHYLSILADQEMYRNVAVFIDGTAHCADLGSSKPTDPESLTDARMAIARYVTQFLDLAYASVSMH